MLDEKILKKLTDSGCEIATDAFMAELDAKSDALKADILSTKTGVVPADGCTAYYVSNDGCDDADGKSPETAWATIPRVNAASLAIGDCVYFRRGDLFRGHLDAAKGVTYSAYGEGKKPILSNSPCDGAKTGKWEETEVPGIYRFSEKFKLDVGLLVFNDESYAIKCTCMFSEETMQPIYDLATGVPFTSWRDLPADLFFYHDLGGPVIEDKVGDGGYVYLRSDEGNPAERFDSIEFNPRPSVIGIKGGGVTIDNLCVKHTGVHGISSGTTQNLTVQHCEFAWIGGGLQYYSKPNNGVMRPTRLGNAVEIYGSCKDYTVKHCYIHDVYDAGVTHQRKGTGVADPYIMEDILYADNLFVNCIYSIEYFNEQPDNDFNIMRNFTIKGNICRCAGGFGWQRPDKVARHIQGGWLGVKREYPAENYVVTDNIFDRSIDVLLSCSSVDIKDMPLLEGNTYVQHYGKNFGMVGVPYDKYYPYADNVSEVVRDIAGDKGARIVVIDEPVKSTYEEDFRVNEMVAKIKK